MPFIMVGAILTSCACSAIFGIGLLMGAGASSSTEIVNLPTEYVIPSETATATATETLTPTPTFTDEPITLTPTETPTETPSPTITETPTASDTPQNVYYGTPSPVPQQNNSGGSSGGQIIYQKVYVTSPPQVIEVVNDIYHEVITVVTPTETAQPVYKINLVSPVNYSLSQNPVVFQWDKLGNKSDYILILTNLATGVRTEHNATCCELSLSLDDGLYKWRVTTGNRRQKSLWNYVSIVSAPVALPTIQEFRK